MEKGELTVGLLNRPQRKPLSRTEPGILKINKINSAIGDKHR